MKKQFLLGLMAMTLPLTTWAADDNNKFTVTAEEVTYAGDKTTPKITVVDAATGKTAETGAYTISYSIKGSGETYTPIKSSEIRNVGSYKATVSAVGDTYFGYANVEATFEITPKVVTTLTLADGNLTREYDGTAVDNIDLANFVSTTELAEGTEATEKADFLNCLTLKRTEGVNEVNVGSTIRVEVSAKEGATSNYKYDASGRTVNVPLIITPKKLTVTLTPVTYNGEEYSVDDLKLEAGKFTEWNKGQITGVVKDDETNFAVTFDAGKNESGQDVIVKDAKKYSLTATLNTENYTVESVEYEVKPAALTISVTDINTLNGYYGYINPVVLTDLFTFTTFQTGDDAAKLGLTLKRAENEKNEDGTEKVGKCLISLYSEDKVVTFTKKEKEDGYNTTVVGNYEISYTPTYYDLRKKGFAAEGFEYKLNEEADLAYQGKEFTAPKDLLTITYKPTQNPDLEMTLIYGEDYTLEVKPVSPAETVRDAGDKFTVVVKAVDEDECNFRDATAGGYPVPEMTLEVKRAALTIKAPEDASVLSKVYDGKEIGDVTDLYTFEGLVGEDVDENGNIVPGKVLKMYSNQKDAGSSYIVHVIDVIQNTWPTTTGSKDLKNYTFTYDDIQTKKFAILEAEFELDGSKEDESVENLIAAYNGKKVNNVTVKNLTNFMAEGGKGFENNNVIKAKQWYTLVLPFDVKVRELSNLLGYAIVNVPNTDNNDPDKISFKLEMNEVPANTLMAFKVDEDITWDGEEPYTMTFDFSKEADEEAGTTGREIKAQTETIADEAGNQFIGTYKLTTITGDQDWYIWPTNGKWSDAASVFAYNEHGLDIYPLSGYVHFQEKTANARIYMQEADGSTTAINAVTGETVNYAAEGWYSVDGVKLNTQPTQKGIYINNGKKVVIK